MTDRLRRATALKFRGLLNRGIPRKQAILAVLTTLRELGLPNSRTQLYVWCRKFGISTK